MPRLSRSRHPRAATLFTLGALPGAALPTQAQTVATLAGNIGTLARCALATCALAAAFLVPALADPARADVLVSNTDVQSNSLARTRDYGGSASWSQGFTTGSAATLTSIELYIGDLYTVDEDNTSEPTGYPTPAVTLHSGSPQGPLVATLTGPTRLSSGDSNLFRRFSAPENTQLAASTTYYVKITVTATESFIFNNRFTSSTNDKNAEDCGSASMWSISDNSGYSSTADGDHEQQTHVWVITVNGTLETSESGMLCPPRNFQASGGQEQVTLSWEEPLRDGGSPITGYQYRYAQGSSVPESTAWTDVPDGDDEGNSAADERGVVVRNLGSSTTYAFELRAMTAQGQSPAAGPALAITARAVARPTGGDSEVTMERNTRHQFRERQFEYQPAEPGNEGFMWYLEIVTLPADGMLMYATDQYYDHENEEFVYTFRPVTEGEVIGYTALNLSNLFFMPDANEYGSPYTTFTFRVASYYWWDNTIHTKTINVTTENYAPTGTDATVSIAEDTAHTFSTANFDFQDQDDDDELVSIRIVTLPDTDRGELRLDGVAVTANDVIERSDIDADKLTYTPPADANGDDYASFTFKVSDGTDESFDTYTMTIDVTPENDAPVFAATTLTRALAENTPAGENVGDPIPEANDIDGDTVTYSLEGADADSFDFDVSTRRLATKTGVDYDHEAKSSYSVTIKADDGAGATDTVAVTIDVTDVDEPPDAPQAPGVTATAGSTTSLDVVWTAPANDGRPAITDYDLRYCAGAPADCDMDGDYTDGPQDVTGTSTAIPGLMSDTAYQVQVRARNDEGDGDWSDPGAGRTANTAPTAESGEVETNEDTPYAFKAADFRFADEDAGDALARVRIVSLPDTDRGELRLDGVAVTANDVIERSDIDADKLTYTPPADANGDDYASFMFKVSDGTDESFDTYTMTIDVEAENDAPVFDDDTLRRALAENTPAGENVGDPIPEANDIDGDTMTYSMEGADADSFDFDVSTRRLATKSGVDYDHEAKSSYTVTIKAADGNGATDTVAVTIDVTDVDEPPDAPQAPGVTATAGSTTSLDVVWTAPANDGRPAITDYDLRYCAGAPADCDMDGDYTDGPQDVTGTSTAIPGLMSDTAYQVQVRARNDEGDGDWSDPGAGRTANTAPTAESGEVETNEDTPYAFKAADFRFADEDAGDVLARVRIVSLPDTDRGELRLDGVAVTANDVIERSDIDADKLTYTPPADANGDDYASFMFKVSDGTDESFDTYTMTIDVEAENDAPVFDDDTLRRALAENTPAGENVGDPIPEANDIDGDTMTYSMEGADADSFDFDVSTRRLATKSGVDYDHEAKSSYTVTIKAADGNGATDTVAVTIDVTDVDEPPDAPQAPGVTATAGSTTSLDVVWTAPANDGRPAITDYDLRYCAGAPADCDMDGDYTDGPQDVTGTSTAIPGLMSDTAYQVQVRARNDEGDGDWSDPGAGRTANTAPTAESGEVETNEDTPYAFKAADFRFADEDAGDVLARVRIVSLPDTDRGELRLDGVAVTANDVIERSDIDADKLTYTPPADANGDDYASFMFKVSDGTDESFDTYTMTIDVEAENDAPVFDDDTLRRALAENTPAGENVGDPIPEANDIDGDTMTYSMEGADADSFDFDVSTRRLATKSGVDYDHEAKSSYTVTIKAADGNGATDTVAVTIDVTDVDEPPDAPQAPGVTATAGSTTSLDVVWTAPANDGRPAITDYDLRYCAGAPADCDMDGDYTDGPQDVTGTSTAIPGLMSDTAYQVQVRARNDEGDGDWSDPGAGRTANTAPTAESGEVETNEDTPYAFKAADFRFADEDAGDALARVRIVSLPDTDRGELRLDGVAVTANDVIERSDIDADKLTYTPPADANGDDYASFMFKVSDGTDESFDTYTMTIDVTPENDAPVFDDDTLTRALAENTPAGTNVGDPIPEANDIDGDTVTYSLEGADADSFDFDVSTRRLATKTGVDYDHEAKSSYSVTIKADDGNSATDTVAVTIAVTDVDEPPDAPQAPGVTATAGSTTSLDVVWTAPANDGRPAITDYDLRYCAGAPADCDMDGDYTDGPQDVTGTSTAIPGLMSDTAYQVQVRARNDEGDGDWSDPGAGRTANTAPTAESGEVETNEDTPYAFKAADFRFADEDAGDALARVRIVSLPDTDRGELRLDGVAVTANDVIERSDIDADKLTYTPPADANGDDYASFMFKVSDGTDESFDTYTMTIDVEAENDAPTLANAIADLSATVDADFSYTVPADAFADVDGDTLEYAATKGDDTALPTWLDFTATTRTFEGTPGADDIGALTVKVTASDPSDESASDEFVITVSAAPNAAPTASDKTVRTPEDTPYPFTAADFNFADEDAGDTLASVRVTSVEAAGDLELDGTDVTAGQVIMKADIDAGRLIFTPAENANGAGYATFMFKVSDGTDESFDTYTMTIDVTPENDAPVFDDDTLTRALAENTPAGENVGDPIPQANDIDGDTVTYSLEGADADSFDFDVSTRRLATKTGVDYDHEAKSSYSVTIKADDGNSATDTVAVTIAVTDVDEPPDAPQAPGVTATAGSTTSLDVVWTAPANDGRPAVTDYDLRYCAGAPADCDMDGDYTDGPQDVTGTSTAIPGLMSDTAYQVQVRARNDEGDGDWSDPGAGRTANTAPTAESGEVETNEDTPYAFKAADFRFADEDAGDALARVRIVSLPDTDRGELRLDGVAVTANDVIERSDIDADKLTYTPPADANGDDYASFMFKVSDGDDESTSAYTMTVDVEAVNDPATGAPVITGTARANETLTANADAIADDADGLPAPSAFTWQWLRVGDPDDVEIPGATGTTYTLVETDAGERFRVRVRFTDLDGHAEELISEATLAAQASMSSNVAPTAVTGTVTLAEDGSYAFKEADFGFADDDAGDVLESVRIVTLPAAGALKLADTAVTEGQVVAASELGALVFTPEANANGTNYTSFMFKVSDGAAESVDTYTMTIHVTAENDAPVFDDDTLTRALAENTPAGENVGDPIPQANDIDGDTMTYSMEGADADSFDFDVSTRRLATKSGVDYDHEAKSSYTVTIKAADGNGATDTVAVTIDVTDVDEPPDAPQAPGVTATAGSTTSLDVVWTAPANDGRPAITDYDLRYCAGAPADCDMDGDYTDGPQDVTGTSTAIPGLMSDTAYQVQVRARNDEGDGDWSDPGPGRTAAPADTTAPAVASIERLTPAASPTNADTLTWRVTFSEDVANVDATDFTVTGTTATLAVTEATASTVHDVTASGGNLASLDGTVTLGFAAGQNITDTADTPNALTDTAPTGADERSYDLDNTAPALVSAVVGGTTLVLTYDEALDTDSAPAPSAYSVSVAGSAVTPSTVSVSDSQVVLTLAAEAAEDAAVTVSYTAPATNPVRDGVGNEAAALDAQPVTRSLIRLVDGAGEHEGRVEVFHAGAWGTVCDDYWTKVEADVACRMAGYSEGSVDDAGRFLRAHFGEGTGPIWLDDLQCRGDEENLFDCPRARSPAVGEHNCRHSEDAGVRCLVAEETAPPRVTGVTLNARPGDAWNAGETVEVTLAWSEAVVVETPAGGEPPKVWIGFSDEAHPHDSGMVRHAEYASGSGTKLTVFSYTLQAGDYESVQVYRDSLRLRDGTIRSATSAVAAVLGHKGHPEAQPQIEAPEAAAEPTISGPGPDDAWTPGETVEVGLAFDRQVLVTTTGGTPSVEIGFLNGQKRRAAYTFGSRTHELIFAYTLTEGDGTQNAILVTRDSLTLGGGLIRGWPDLAPAALGHESAAKQAGPARVVAPAEPTGSFSGVPDEHDGRSAFTLGFTMSEAPKAPFSFKTVRDHLFEVTGARLQRAKRAEPGKDRAWNLTFFPGGKGAVTVRMRETRSCDASPRVCTEDGRPLTGEVSVTIPGPAQLSVADAEAQEGAGAVLDFVVTLSRARTGATTVDYATADDTATADEDYEARSGTLTFDAGVTERTISVAVRDDAHDEGVETLTLTLTNPAPAAYVRLGDAVATGRIGNHDPMPRAWMVRFGRTVAEQALDAFGARLEGARTSHLTVAGITVTGAAQAAPEAAPEDPFARPAWAVRAREPEARTLTRADVVLGTRFHLGAGGEEGEGGALTVWGNVATGGFGAAVDAGTLDGEASTGFVGFDAEWGGALAGVMLSHSRGRGGYRFEAGAGKVESALTGVYPYARLDLGARLSAWGLAGAGSGAITLSPEGKEAMKTDLSMRMAAAGTKGQVLDGSGPSGVAMHVRTDALWVGTRSAALAGELAASEGDATRVRLVVDAERTFETAGGGALTPSAVLGLRRDGGDAETGTGVEVGGGLRYSRGDVSFEARARVLAAHEASGYEEWGASAALRVSPGAGGRGLTLTVAPEWGRSASGAQALWNARDARGLVSGDAFEAARGLDAELGYGLGLGHGRGVLTPYAGWSLGDGGAGTVRGGVRFALGRRLAAGLEAARSAADGANEVRLHAALRF